MKPELRNICFKYKKFFEVHMDKGDGSKQVGMFYTLANAKAEVKYLMTKNPIATCTIVAIQKDIYEFHWKRIENAQIHG